MFSYTPSLSFVLLNEKVDDRLNALRYVHGDPKKGSNKKFLNALKYQGYIPSGMSTTTPEKALEKVLYSLADADPTAEHDKGKYIPWIARQVATGNIRLPEDIDKVKMRLSEFDTHKQASKAKFPKDINQYKSFGDLAKTMNKHLGPEDTGFSGSFLRSLSPSDYNTAKDGTEVVYQGKMPEGGDSKFGGITWDALKYGDGGGSGDGWEIIKVKSPEASAILCHGTDWCVKDPAWSAGYLKRGPFYMIANKGKREALFHADSGQFMDPTDSSMKAEKRAYYQPLGIKIAEDMMSDLASGGDMHYNKGNISSDILKTVEMFQFTFPKNHPFYDLLKKEPHLAQRYSDEIMKKPYPLGSEEDLAIASDPHAAHNHHRAWGGPIRAKYKDAEDVFYPKDHPAWQTMWAQPEVALDLAKESGKPYPEDHPAVESISKDPHTAYQYASGVTKKPYPEDHPAMGAISKSPKTALNYAYHFVGPYPEGHPALETILKNPNDAFMYTNTVLRAPHPDGHPHEEIIRSGPMGSIYDEWKENYRDAGGNFNSNEEFETVKGGYQDWYGRARPPYLNNQERWGLQNQNIDYDIDTTKNNWPVKRTED